MINAIKIVILATIGLIVSLPFFGTEEEQPVSLFHEDKKAQLLSEKESLYSAIKELDFDHEMGKLSDEDYEQLKQEYTAKALTALKALDQFEEKTDNNSRHTD